VSILYAVPIAQECLTETSPSSNISKMTYFSNQQQMKMKYIPRYLLCVSAIHNALVYDCEIPEESIF